MPLLVVGLATGLGIWALSRVDPLAPMAVIAVHAYAGLLSLPILAAKVWAGVRSWRRRAAKSGPHSSRALHLLTLGLLLAALALYGSGTLMYLNLTPGGNAVYKQVHLWSAVAAAPLVSHHLYLYLRGALGAIGRTAASPPGGVRMTRGRLLRLGGALVFALGSVRVVRGFLESLSSEDPNDFPVTLTSGGADSPDPEDWRLLVSGGVAEPMQFSLDGLRGARLGRSTYSLDCVIGWSVVREWGGIPVIDLIRQARPHREVLSAVFRSTTGYEVALPLEVLEDRRTMVTLEVGGVPLAVEHGFPARLMAPDVVGEKCVKWLAEIEVVTAG